MVNVSLLTAQTTISKEQEKLEEILSSLVMTNGSSFELLSPWKIELSYKSESDRFNYKKSFRYNLDEIFVAISPMEKEGTFIVAIACKKNKQMCCDFRRLDYDYPSEEMSKIVKGQTLEFDNEYLQKEFIKHLRELIASVN